MVTASDVSTVNATRSKYTSEKKAVPAIIKIRSHWTRNKMNATIKLYLVVFSSGFLTGWRNVSSAILLAKNPIRARPNNNLAWLVDSSSSQKEASENVWSRELKAFSIYLHDPETTAISTLSKMIIPKTVKRKKSQVVTGLCWYEANSKSPSKTASIWKNE